MEGGITCKVQDDELSLICQAPNCDETVAKSGISFSPEIENLNEVLKAHILKAHKDLIYVDESGMDRLDLICDKCKRERQYFANLTQPSQKYDPCQS
jgi:hypothetical protein